MRLVKRVTDHLPYNNVVMSPFFGHVITKILRTKRAIQPKPKVHDYQELYRLLNPKSWFIEIVIEADSTFWIPFTVITVATLG